jgi:hypothetical protein
MNFYIFGTFFAAFNVFSQFKLGAILGGRPKTISGGG